MPDELRRRGSIAAVESATSALASAGGLRGDLGARGVRGDFGRACGAVGGENSADQKPITTRFGLNGSRPGAPLLSRSRAQFLRLAR